MKINLLVLMHPLMMLWNGMLLVTVRKILLCVKACEHEIVNKLKSPDTQENISGYMIKDNMIWMVIDNIILRASKLSEIYFFFKKVVKNLKKTITIIRMILRCG